MVSGVHNTPSGGWASWFDLRSRESLLSAFLLFAIVCVLLAAAAYFELASPRLLKIGCVNLIAALALGLFSGSTGVLSLGHVAFFGIGAYVSAWFTLIPAIKGMLLPDMPVFIQQSQWSLWFAVIPAIIAGLLAGVLTGFVMRRLRDTSAVIASFGFLVIFYLLFIGLKIFTNGKQSLYALPIDQLSWPLTMTAIATALLVTFAIRASALGRAAESLRDNEAAARSVGVDADRTFFWVWVASAALMAMAGALFAHSIGIASPSSFYLDKTFALIVMIIVGGYRSLTGCALGAVLITIVEELLKHAEESLGALAGQQVLGGLIEMPRVFGLTALCFSAIILLVLYLRPEGVIGYRELAQAGLIRRLFGRWLEPASKGEEQVIYSVPKESELSAQSLGKNYGYFSAMSDVSFEVGPGEIVGLIGPNGAGKSTFINVMTGNLFASSGAIFLNGENATQWSAHDLARRGMGRTFQNIRLFASLSTLDNVLTSVNVASPKLSRVDAEVLAMNWLRELNLDQHALEAGGSLAYGDQRRLEIARALALEPHFLLLDEPAAGMNDSETHQLQQLLKDIVQRIGCGVILIEHDMPMVMALCDRLVVLNKGEQIASGPVADVRKDPQVIEAYIGESP